MKCSCHCLGDDRLCQTVFEPSLTLPSNPATVLSVNENKKKRKDKEWGCFLDIFPMTLLLRKKK